MGWILLEGEDVLLFRDSRPFSAGEDFRAEGVFPPLPTPVAGAVRSALLAPLLRARGLGFSDLAAHPNLADERAALGDADGLGQLHLAGPLVCRYTPGADGAEPLFALPADALPRGFPRLRDDLTPPGLRKPAAGLPDPLPMAVLENENIPAGGEWLAEAAMADYLRGERQANREALPALAEARTGLQRGAARTAESGRLYTAQLHRLPWKRETAVGLLARVLLPPGWTLSPQYAPLGGEARSVFMRPLPRYVPTLDSPALRQEISDRILHDGGRFRLYLATPAVFERGLLPSAFPAGAALVGAASGKPIAVSGWDLARRAPRPLRRAVPAGTVYFGQLARPTADAVDAMLNTYHFQRALQEHDADGGAGQDEARRYGQMGFGLSLVGAWTQPLPASSAQAQNPPDRQTQFHPSEGKPA